MISLLQPGQRPTAAAMRALSAGLESRLTDLLSGHSPLLLPDHASRAINGEPFATSFGAQRLYGAPFVFASGTRAYTAGATTHNQAAYDSAVAAATILTQDDTHRIVTIADPGINLDGSMVAHTRDIDGVPYAVRVGNRLQTRYSLGVAEIICEGVVQLNLRGSDTYDCYRVHNLSREFPLTVTFDGYTLSVPAHSCRTLRRTGAPGSYTYHEPGTYLWPVLSGDPRLLAAGVGIAARMVSGQWITAAPERSMAANNIAHPLVALGWLSACESTDITRYPGWRIDRSLLTDLGAEHRALFAHPDDANTILGDLIHHKGTLSLIKTLDGTTTYETVPFKGHGNLHSLAPHIAASHTPDGALRLEPAQAGASITAIGFATNLLGYPHAAALPHTAPVRPAILLADGRFGSVGSYHPGSMERRTAQRSATYTSIDGSEHTVSTTDTYYSALDDDADPALTCHDTVDDLIARLADVSAGLEGKLVYDGAQWSGIYALPTDAPIASLPIQYDPRIEAGAFGVPLVWVMPWFASRYDDGTISSGLTGLWSSGGWWQSPRADRVYGTLGADESSPDWSDLSTGPATFQGIVGKDTLPIRVISQCPAEPAIHNSPTPQAFALIIPPPDNLDAAVEHWSEPGWWTQHGDDVLAGIPPISTDRFLRLGLFVEHYNLIADLLNSITRIRPLLYTDLRFVVGAEVFTFTANATGLQGTSIRPANQFARLITLVDSNDLLAAALNIPVRSIGDFPAAFIAARSRYLDTIATANVYRLDLTARCSGREAIYYSDIGQWMGRNQWTIQPSATLTWQRTLDYNPIGGRAPVTNAQIWDDTNYNWLAADDILAAATRDGWPFLFSIAARPLSISTFEMGAGMQAPVAFPGVRNLAGSGVDSWSEVSGQLRATEADALADMRAVGSTIDYGETVAIPRVYVSVTPATDLDLVHLVQDVDASTVHYNLPRLRWQPGERRDVAAETYLAAFVAPYSIAQIPVGLAYSEPTPHSRAVHQEIETLHVQRWATAQFTCRTGAVITSISDTQPQVDWTLLGKAQYDHRTTYPFSYRPITALDQDTTASLIIDVDDHATLISTSSPASVARVILDHAIRPTA